MKGNVRLGLPIALAVERRPDGAIGAQTIGGDPHWVSVALECFAHEGEGGQLVPCAGDAASPCGSPRARDKPALHSLHEHLVEMPTPMPEAIDAAHPLPPDICCEHWSKAVPPQPCRIVADVLFPLEQQVFHVAQR